VAITVGVISPFTGLAWPFALLTGMVIGAADGRELRGDRGGVGSRLSSTLAVTGGVLAMLFFGAIIGGLIAFLIVALAAFSERAAAFASPTDQGVARIILFLVPVLLWLVVVPLLGLNVNIRFGS
jgi:hypothetical protein